MTRGISNPLPPHEAHIQQAQTEDFLHKLEAGGRRITESRRAVVEAVGQKSAPFTAEELCDDVPGVGRATVFRNIKLLQDMGFLCRVLLEDGSPRYQPSRQSHHHHLVCVQCGAVRDFIDCDVTDMLRSVTERSGFEIAGHRLEVYGRCPTCQKSAQAS